MFLIAGLTSYLLFHFYFQQRARYSYPTVEASIDSVYFSSYRPSGKDYTIQSANLAYSYAIMGSRYSGRSTAIDQYGELMTITSGTFDKQAVAELRNKSNVSVYYNPEDPSDSFITPEVNGGLLVGAIIGCLFSLLGLVGMFTAVFTKRQNHTLNEDQAKQVIEEAQKRFFKE